MSTALRRIVMASAVLLALALLLWQRLDLTHFDAYIQQQTATLKDTRVSIGSSRLSFLHGVGLRLDNVVLTHPKYRMQADHIDVSVHLLPLLLGKIEIASLAVHQGTFTIAPSLLLQTSVKSLASLPTEQIQLIRCHLFTDTGKQILKNIFLDLRDIGSNRETLWEFQAQKDTQSLRGHGRLGFRGGEISKGFGKLKLHAVSVSALQPFAPEAMSNWFDSPDNQLSGTLTLDITGHHRWAVFGEMQLQTSRYPSPLHLRGKINHPAEDHFEWHDSFIHFDDKTAISVAGKCLKSKCATDIDAKNIPLSSWLPLLPDGLNNTTGLHARSDVSTHIQWHASSWQARAEMNLHKVSYQIEEHNLPLPDIHIQQTTAKGSHGVWQLAGQMNFSNTDDQMAFSMARKHAATNIAVHSQQLETVWPTLANLLLATWGFDPSLQGHGAISGDIEIGLTTSAKHLKLKLNATAANIRYPQFSKPATTTAICQADIQWQNLHHNTIPTSATLHHCQLHTARVGELHWQQKHGYHLRAKGLSIDFDALQKQSVTLPDILLPFHGQLSADFNTTWQPNDKILWPWVSQAEGKLNVQRFGTSLWKSSGLMHAEHGTFHSQHLHIQGIHGNADLKGHFDFSKKEGNIDVLTANLDWQNMPALNPAWQHPQLSGRIHQGHVKLLGNLWHDIQGRYDFRQGELTVRNFSAGLAQGTVSAPKLRLIASNHSLLIAGKMRAKDIDISEVRGLDRWLQASVDGKLHANVKLSGHVPAANIHDWRGSNGDILIYDGTWAKTAPATSLTEKIGLSTPPLQRHAFRKLAIRFRVGEQSIVLPKIFVRSRGQTLNGRGRILGQEGVIHGQLADDNGNTYILNGQWPVPVLKKETP